MHRRWPPRRCCHDGIVTVTGSGKRGGGGRGSGRGSEVPAALWIRRPLGPKAALPSAHGAVGAMADYGGADGGPVAAVALINPLKDLLPALALEIHVDIRGLLAFRRDETLEQQAGAHRVRCW